MVDRCSKRVSFREKKYLQESTMDECAGGDVRYESKCTDRQWW